MVEALVYIHEKNIFHNDAKGDNVLIARNGDLKTPILIDFGRACRISEAKRKVLSKDEQAKYRQKHSHIDPEVVDGTQLPRVKSDVDSAGVVFSNVYKPNKIKLVKEIARKCLQEHKKRCNTSELKAMLGNFRKL